MKKKQSNKRNTNQTSQNPGSKDGEWDDAVEVWGDSAFMESFDSVPFVQDERDSGGGASSVPLVAKNHVPKQLPDHEGALSLDDTETRPHDKVGVESSSSDIPRADGPSGSILDGIELEYKQPDIVGRPLPDFPERLRRIELHDLEVVAQVETCKHDDTYWSRVYDELTVAAKSAQSSSVAAELECAAAHACEQLNQENRAVQRFSEAFSCHPQNISAILGLWRLEKDTAPETSSRHLSALTDVLSQRGRKRLASLCADMKWANGDTDAASSLIQEDDGTLRQLIVRANLAACLGDEPKLRSIVREIVSELQDESSHAAALSTDIGHALEVSGAYQSAAESYRKATALQPHNPSAWQGLFRTSLALNDWDAAFFALKQSAPLWQEWAPLRLLRTHALSPSGHAEGSRSVEILQVLRQAAALAPEEPLALELLKHALIERELWEEAGGVVQRLLGVARDPAEKTRVLVDAGRLATLAGLSELAQRNYEEALRIEPQNERALRALWQSAFAHGASDLRFETYIRAADMAENAVRAAHLLAAAQIGANLGLSAERLNPLLMAAVDSDPSSDRSVTGAVSTMLSTKQHAQFAELVVHLAKQRSGDDAIHLWQMAAELYEGCLADTERALECYDQAANLGSAVAFWGQQRCLQAMRREHEIVSRISEQISQFGESEDKARLYRLCGDACWNRDAEAARKHYNAALSLDVDDMHASWASSVLEASFENWSGVAQRYRDMAAKIPEVPLIAASLWMRAGAVFEHAIGDHRSALTAYRTAEAVSDGENSGIEDCISRCLSVQDTPHMEQTIRTELETTTRASQRYNLLVRLGGLLRETSDKQDDTAQCFTEANDIACANGQNGDVAVDATIVRQAMAKSLRDAARWSEYCEVLAADDVVPLDAEDAMVAAVIRAESYWVAGDKEQASALYRHIRQQDPNHLGSISFLIAEKGAQERTNAELLSIFCSQIASVETVAERAAYWIDLARVLGCPFGGSVLSDDARAALENALEWHPMGCWLVDRLVHDLDAYETDSDHKRALCVAAQSIDDANYADKSVLLTRIGELNGGDISAYEQAVDACSDYWPCVVKLKDAAVLQEKWQQAYKASLKETLTSSVQKHIVAAECFCAEIATNHIHDTVIAKGHLQKAVALEGPTGEAFKQLRILLETQKEWQALFELLSNAVTAEPHASRQCELYRSLALLALEKIDDKTKAKEYLLLAADIDGEDTWTLSKLTEIFEEEGDWASVAEIMAHWAEIEENENKRAGVLCGLGHVYYSHLKALKRAEETYGEALKLDPRSRVSLETLAEIHLSQNEAAKAAAMFQQLSKLSDEPARQVDALLQLALVEEEQLSDLFKAGQALRRAVEIAPDDLKAVGALCKFHARQNDERGIRIHIDTALAAMRERLSIDPYEAFAARALFTLFGWRQHPDGCLCSADLLRAIGGAEAEECDFIEANAAKMGAVNESFDAHVFDRMLCHPAVPSGFSAMFQALSEPLARIHRGDLKSHGAGRINRIVGAQHPVKSIADTLARVFSVSSYELYVLDHEPRALIVENGQSPAILLGSELLQDATEAEIQFILGRCLWLVSRSLVLPARLVARDVGVLVAAIVSQFLPEYSPEGVDPAPLASVARQIAKPVRKLHQELMPLALECSGESFEPAVVSAGVIHSANRAGLLVCRSVTAAYRALCRAAEQSESDDNPEAEELLRFSVSNEYLELRRELGIAIADTTAMSSETGSVV